jgi:inositol hexakisphosphate/diphosphoinositol-pentakisphosphate kinase
VRLRASTRLYCRRLRATSLLTSNPLTVAYVELRKPVCVNDLPLQKIFWDRRVVLQILDKIGVPTPARLECNRDGGPQLDKGIADQIQQSLGVRVDKPRPTSDFSMEDEDTIVVDGKKMHKPFVEKPVSGENHNVNIYFPKSKGGGARRLFRKVSNYLRPPVSAKGS